MADFWDFVARKDGRQRLTRWVFTINGMGAPYWAGPQADVAQWLINNNPHWRWRPTGYNASPFPMQQFVAQAVNQIETDIAETLKPGDEWVLLIYSEGGIAGFELYQRMKTGVSPVSWALPGLKIVCTWGFPNREKGKANGNAYAGWPMPDPTYRGIAQDRMVDTPDSWYDFVHGGAPFGVDMYTMTPDGDGKGNTDYLVGQDMTMIFNIVQDPKAIIMGPNSFFKQIFNLLVSPVKEIPSLFLAIWNGIKFLAAPGGPTMPHLDYDVTPAIAMLDEYGTKVPIPL
jgi:hypothetical protein